jgi:hypothetical protein
VNAIVGSFKPERSQSSEKRLKRTVVLAALQQALRREATTSRRNLTSSQVAQTDDLGATDTPSSTRSNSAMSRRPSRAGARVARNGTDGPRRSAPNRTTPAPIARS